MLVCMFVMFVRRSNLNFMYESLNETGLGHGHHLIACMQGVVQGLPRHLDKNGNEKEEISQHGLAVL